MATPSLPFVDCNSSVVLPPTHSIVDWKDRYAVPYSDHAAFGIGSNLMYVPAIIARTAYSMQS